MTLRLRALSPVLALLLLPLGGCDWMMPKISKEIMEKELAAWLESHDLHATEITCPDNQLSEKGNKFECQCKVQGVDVPVSVEVTSATGDVEWAPKYTTLPSDQIEAELKVLPELAGRSLAIDCKTVMVSVPDSTWTCDVVDAATPGQPWVLTVNFTNAEGGYEWKLEPAP